MKLLVIVLLPSTTFTVYIPAAHRLMSIVLTAVPLTSHCISVPVLL